MNWKTRIDIHQYIKLGKDLNDDDLVPANIREGLIKEIEKLPFHLRNHCTDWELSYREYV